MFFSRETLLKLSSIAQKIQDDRESAGALTLESSEVRFEFDDSLVSKAGNMPEEIRPKEHLKVGFFSFPFWSFAMKS